MIDRYENNKKCCNIADLLRGNINRLCVTDNIDELNIMHTYALKRIDEIYNTRLELIEKLEKSSI